jgi:hypothetical protein
VVTQSTRVGLTRAVECAFLSAFEIPVYLKPPRGSGNKDKVAPASGSPLTYSPFLNAPASGLPLTSKFRDARSPEVQSRSVTSEYAKYAALESDAVKSPSQTVRLPL